VVEGKLQGTGNVDERIQKGASYLPARASGAVEPPQGFAVNDAQHWLKTIGLPLNMFKPKASVQVNVLGRARLISDDAPGDIQHIVMQLPEGMLVSCCRSFLLVVMPRGNHTRLVSAVLPVRGTGTCWMEPRSLSLCPSC
jgi:hypothetical protein